MSSCHNRSQRSSQGAISASLPFNFATAEIAHILDDFSDDLIGIQAWDRQIDHNDKAFSACSGGFNPPVSLRVCDHLSA